MGRAELAGNSVEGRMMEIQRASLDTAGVSRLEQIRSSMAGEQLAANPQRPAVEQQAASGAGADPNSAARLDAIRASLAKEQGGTGDAGTAS